MSSSGDTITLNKSAHYAMEGVCSHDKLLHIVYFNARTLIPRLGELRVICELQKPDIVCITEMWLCEEVGLLECSIHGYHCLRCDRHRHGGGVALFISNHLHSHIILCGPHQLKLLLVSVHNTHGPWIV